MEEADKFDRVEKYLAGTLNAEERKAFEQDLEEDETLKAELNLHKDLAETLKSEELHKFRNLLEKTNENWSNKTSEAKQISLMPRVFAAIAAAILLLVLAYQFILRPTSISSDELFAANYTSYNMVLKERSGDALSADLNEAIVAYNRQDYEQAADLFNRLYNQTPEQLSYQFYAAQAALSANRVEVAIEQFSRLLDQEGHPFLEQSRWYLALAYLKKDALPEAKLLLQEIKEGQYNYKGAKDLLKSPLFNS